MNDPNVVHLILKCVSFQPIGFEQDRTKAHTGSSSRSDPQAASSRSLMSRRSTGERESGSPEREPSGSRSLDSSPGDGPGTTPTVAAGGVQFLTLRSRVGKRYQATIPEFRPRTTEPPRHVTPRARFSPDRADGKRIRR